MSLILRSATNFAVTASDFRVAGIRLLRFCYVVTSAASIYLLGVAGFAATIDYSYFIMDGFISCADNFVFTIIGFAVMAEYFIVAGLELRVRHEQPPSATSLHLLGATGTAATADHSDYAQTAKFLFIFNILYLFMVMR
jgi:hypothetical protein